MKTPAALLLALPLFACASMEEEIVAGNLPTPYTASQIQESCAPGTVVVFRIETPGGAPMLQSTEFVGDDGANATFLARSTDEAGQPLGNPREATAPWSELRDHASFPASATTREPARCTTALGTFDAWLYENTERVEGRPDQVHRFWFAHDLPGPPVLLETSVEGEVVMRMEMVARTGRD